VLTSPQPTLGARECFSGDERMGARMAGGYTGVVIWLVIAGGSCVVFSPELRIR
jgi:hypothetical protein